LVRAQSLKTFGDQANLGDRTQRYSQWVCSFRSRQQRMLEAYNQTVIHYSAYRGISIECDV